MRHLNSEHISCVASMLFQACGGKVRKAVECAIELQVEAEKQCDARNKKLDELPPEPPA